mmetsp:Transcript_9752/g.44415  ORF Transcript_9752/g.44415 Transcript_9752/m.44415 type:complete len:421 (+) Transcript_9752:290-1552(+)
MRISAILEPHGDHTLGVGGEHLHLVNRAEFSALSLHVLLELHPKVQISEHLVQREHVLDDHRRLFPILGVVEASPPELSLLLGDGGGFALLAALALFGHKVPLHLKLRGGHRHVGAHRVPERRPVQDGTRELDAGFLEVGHQPVSFQRVRLFVPVEFDPRRGGVTVELDDAALAEHLLHLVHVDVVGEARDVDGGVGLEVEPPGAVAVVRVRHPGLLSLGASLLLLLDGVDGHRAHLRRGWIFGRLLGIGPDVVVVVAAAFLVLLGSLSLLATVRLLALFPLLPAHVPSLDLLREGHERPFQLLRVLELALLPKLALTDVAPVQTGTLEPYLVHLPAVLLAVGGEFLEPRLAVGSLFLQSLECLLGFAGGAFLLRDAVLAARLFELCPVMGLDLVPVRLRVRRAVLHDDVDDVEEVPFVV